MAQQDFQSVELVNEAGDTRTATSAAALAQSTFDGFYVDDKVQLSAAKKAAKDAPKADSPKAPTAASGNTASGEKTVGSNPS